MLFTVLFTLVALMALVLIIAATRPDHFHVERSTLVKTSADKIFPHINDLKAWEAWTPYNRDPAMTKSYGSSTMGQGATYAWEGNKDVGKGDIRITHSVPPSELRLTLHFDKPFKATNKVTFTLTQNGDSTQVTWGMDGKNNLLSKVMGLFINMDDMIGKDFQAGLDKLKTLAEK